MKKIYSTIIISILVLTVISNSVIAQQSNQNTNKATEIVAKTKQRLMQNLKITESQANSVIAIQQKYMATIENIKSDTSISASVKEQKIKPVKEAMLSEITGVVGATVAKKIDDYHHYLHEDALIVD